MASEKDPTNISDILAVVVLYNSTFEGSDTMISISNALKEVNGELNILIYDNSPHPCYDKPEFKVNRFNITYIFDPSNPGVSKAYNIAASIAKSKNKKWLLLLDQDTRFNKNILQIYIDTLNTMSENINLITPILKLPDGKIFSPCIYKLKRGFKLNKIKEGVHYLNKISPVNSGMLIRVTSFFESGGYNEKVKLDFSDFQFIERFRKKNNTFQVVDSVAIQNFSDEIQNLTSALNRFKIFCNCAKNCEKFSLKDRVLYFGITALRATKLLWKFKNASFVFIWYKSYLK